MVRLLFLITLSLSFSTCSFASKTVLITSATGALGKAISSHLASEGYDLVLAGRNTEKLENLKDEISKTFKSCHVTTLIVDFSDIGRMRESITKASLGPIHGIVLITPRPDLLKSVIPAAEEWTKTLQETFVAPLESLRLLTPFVQEAGSIVVMAGNTSKSYLPDYPNTNVIRLAWVGEIKNLTCFFASKGIRVNAISPGPILTDYHRHKLAKEARQNGITFEEQLAKRTALIPLGTYGTTADVSNLVHFLLSEKAAHINGTNMVLDGGESTGY
jgi:3-oxoacyl-[acyl-carrier protein] reductase